MEKRVILTIVICMGLLLVWQQLFPPPKQPPGKKADGGVSAKADGGAGETAKKSADGGTAGTPATAAKPGEPAKKVESDRPAEVVTSLSNKWIDASFSSYGASLKSWRFKDRQYQREEKGKLAPVDLVTTSKEAELPLRLDYTKSSFTVPAGAVWTLEKKTDREDLQELVYVFENEQVKVTKTFRIVPNKKEEFYRLKMQVELLNKGAKDASEWLGVRYTGYQDPNASTGGGLLSPPVQPRSAVCLVNGKYESEEVKNALKGKSFDGAIQWVGINEHYFLAVVIPKGNESPNNRRCAISGNDPGTMIAQLNFPERTVAPQKTTSRDFVVYLGPKVIKRLDDEAVKLEATVDFGWHGWLSWLCRPMLWLLQLFFSWFGNWGLAIILLTITVKVATIYWTQKSMMSMKAMSKLAPKVNELKEKYKDDRNRMNVEVMNLYKQYKVNPLGGCLPMLLQMPIYIALYTTLNNAVEIYRTPFAGWIKDLSARDPYYILPVVLGATMFVQQKLSPTTMDNAQARLMMYFMPLMFTFFMLFLPAGLTLYILVNTLLGIAHQYYMNSLDPDKPTAPSKPAAKPARA